MVQSTVVPSEIYCNAPPGLSGVASENILDNRASSPGASAKKEDDEASDLPMQDDEDLEGLSYDRDDPMDVEGSDDADSHRTPLRGSNEQNPDRFVEENFDSGSLLTNAIDRFLLMLGTDFVDDADEDSAANDVLTTSRHEEAESESSQHTRAMYQIFHSSDPVEPTKPFKLPTNTDSFRAKFTPDERVLLRLHKICRKARAPLYLIDEIMDVILEETNANGFNVTSGSFPKYNTFLGRMRQQFPPPQLQKTPVTLEGVSPHDLNYTSTPKDHANVIRFSPRDQISDLLSDHILFGNRKNLEGVVNWDDPFGKLGSKDGSLNEIVDGEWYHKTYEEVEKLQEPYPDEPFMVVPGSVYLDKTGTDVYQRHAMEPVLLMLAILNRTCRNRKAGKRLLGYLPDLDLKSSAAKEKARQTTEGKGRSLRNYHSCLKTIMDDLAEWQGYKKRVVGYVRIGDEVKKVRLYFPLAIVIGDGKSGDTLCGRFATWNTGLRCRACTCPEDELDNPRFQCENIDQRAINQKSIRAMKLLGHLTMDENEEPSTQQAAKEELAGLREELRAYSRHIHLNAFTNVHMGDNKRCLITGATPTDVMHAFLHGVVPYALRIFILPMTVSEKSTLDLLVDRLFSRFRSSEKKEYPRFNFTRGITDLTMVTADEWAGVAFALVLAMHTREGESLFNKVDERRRRKQKQCCGLQKAKASAVPDKDQSLAAGKADGGDVMLDLNAEKATETICKPEDFRLVMEMLLSFHAWYKCGMPYARWKQDGMENKVHRSVQLMLLSLKTYLPRTIAQGWKLQKFHDLLHLARNMTLYGSILNFDASNGEHSLIAFVKNVVKTVQRIDQAGCLEQSGQRIETEMSIEKALRLLDGGIWSDGYEDEVDELDPDDNDRARYAVGESELQGHPKYHLLFEETEPAARHRISQGDKRQKAHRNLPLVNWYGKTKTKGLREVHPLVINWFIQDRKERGYDASIVNCYTEYKHNGVLFRAHPNYRSKGAWYEWVMVHFDETNNSKSFGVHGKDLYPCKILSFFVDPADNQSICALVHRCASFDEEASSSLCEVWHQEYKSTAVEREELDNHKRRKTKVGYQQLEPVVYKVSVQRFRERILAIEEHPGVCEARDKVLGGVGDENLPRVIVVKDRATHWPQNFLER
jgi:hypothetical protein